ncbi:hypothetical protein [Roseivirga sp. 4D4]|uniref:hypothetical protein n=1 Tax=Roseivirga sp. 4D4 TaxID=1889784 RepID=UPI001112F5A9|nr:hypothetical protein [Roseivirga sp. 4D4]
MKKIIESIESAIPFLQPYDPWVKWLVSVWILVTAGILVALLFGNRSPVPNETKNEPLNQEQNMKWSRTGDRVIDDVITNLNKMEAADSLNQSTLITALSPLFTRPAFYGIREENWEYFLFVLARTRLLLEHYSQHIKSPKSLRDSIQEASILMVQLQNEIKTIYGPAFSVTDHISTYINDKEGFVKNLPKQQIEIDYKFFDARDETIREIRDILKNTGLL